MCILLCVVTLFGMAACAASGPDQGTNAPSQTDPAGAVAPEATKPAEEDTKATEPAPAPTECSHDYSKATCTAAATCKLCGATTGSKVEHQYSKATCTKPATCGVCGATTGSKGEHVYNKTSCTVCGAQNPKYAEIAKALKDVERYPKYIQSNKDLIDIYYDKFKLATSSSKEMQCFNDTHKRVLEIHDYLQKIIKKCGKYEELKMLVEDCEIDMPVVPSSTSTSALRSYISKAKTYALKASRISVLYNVLCDSYGVS